MTRRFIMTFFIMILVVLASPIEAQTNSNDTSAPPMGMPASPSTMVMPPNSSPMGMATNPPPMGMSSSPSTMVMPTNPSPMGMSTTTATMSVNSALSMNVTMSTNWTTTTTPPGGHGVAVYPCSFILTFFVSLLLIL